MLRALVGADVYDAALTLYFDRHDGQACTIEDWLQVFEDASDEDLSQFKRWYSQAGTPRVTLEMTRTEEDYLNLTFRQETRPTPGQPDKAPQVIPIELGLLDPSGAELAARRGPVHPGGRQHHAVGLAAGDRGARGPPRARPGDPLGAARVFRAGGAGTSDCRAPTGLSFWNTIQTRLTGGRPGGAWRKPRWPR